MADKNDMGTIMEFKDLFEEEMVLPSLSVENELRVMEEIGKLCSKTLDSYPDTLSQTLEKFKQDNLSQNEQNIYQILIEEKMALTSMLKITESVIELLKADKNETIEKIKNRQVPENLQDYLTAEILELLEDDFAESEQEEPTTVEEK